jgi:hypothetical protein
LAIIKKLREGSNKLCQKEKRTGRYTRRKTPQEEGEREEVKLENSPTSPSPAEKEEERGGATMHTHAHAHAHLYSIAMLRGPKSRWKGS